MARIFVYDGREFPDPDPQMSVDDVRQSMTNFFPELANAESKPSKRGNDDIIEFRRRVGTKG
jgi:PRTRC genetic system protein C